MSQTTTERDLRTAVLAEAVATWLQASATGSRDEADITLEAVLLEQGILGASDIVSLFDEIVTMEASPVGLGVCVELEDGTEFSVYLDGTVHEA